ncbi:MAG: VOC family protein, partial [Victivallales bacterium]|nr:VOC family protein [Victivallales bacterium]
MVYGILIKVQNLNATRSFYRDILDLGPPVMDSNFWVEFKIGEHASLILEQASPNEKMPEGLGRISWVCNVKDYDTTVERLGKNGFEPVVEEEERLGKKVIQYLDPEGNPFM